MVVGVSVGSPLACSAAATCRRFPISDSDMRCWSYQSQGNAGDLRMCGDCDRVGESFVAEESRKV